MEQWSIKQKKYMQYAYPAPMCIWFLWCMLQSFDGMLRILSFLYVEQLNSKLKTMTSQERDYGREDKTLCFNVFNDTFPCFLNKGPCIFVLVQIMLLAPIKAFVWMLFSGPSTMKNRSLEYADHNFQWGKTLKFTTAPPQDDIHTESCSCMRNKCQFHYRSKQSRIPILGSPLEHRQGTLAEFEAFHLSLGLGNFMLTKSPRESWVCRGSVWGAQVCSHAVTGRPKWESLHLAPGA